MQADAWLLFVSLIWGSTFVLTKQSVAGFPVFAFLSLRFGLATVVLFLAFGQRLKALQPHTVAAGVVVGLLLFAGLAFQTIGLRYTSASKAAFIASMSVAIVPLLSAVVLRQPPTRGALAGVAVATVGLAVLTLTPSASAEWTVGQTACQPGDLITFGCAVFFALQIVAVSLLAPRTDAMAMTILQVAIAAVLSGLAALLLESWPGAIPLDVGVAAAFTGVMATAVAFVVQNAMQPWTSATRTALILTTVPVFAALFGYVLAGECLAPPALAGCGLILLGTALAELRAETSAQ